MPYMTKHVVGLAGRHAADWLKLWCAQLNNFQRYCETLSEVTATWRSGLQSPNASTVREEDAKTAVYPSRADLAAEDVLGRWRKMYQTAVLYEAVNAMQPHAAPLIRGRIEDFHNRIAVEQAHGEPEGRHDSRSS